jgi:hypothetical protein
LGIDVGFIAQNQAQALAIGPGGAAPGIDPDEIFRCDATSRRFGIGDENIWRIGEFLDRYSSRSLRSMAHRGHHQDLQSAAQQRVLGPFATQSRDDQHVVRWVLFFLGIGQPLHGGDRATGATDLDRFGAQPRHHVYHQHRGYEQCENQSHSEYMPPNPFDQFDQEIYRCLLELAKKFSVFLIAGRLLS